MTKTNWYWFSFVFFRISFVFLKIDGRSSKRPENSSKKFWWVFRYMSSSMQLSRPKFRLCCFLVHPSGHCQERIAAYWDNKLQQEAQSKGTQAVVHGRPGCNRSKKNRKIAASCDGYWLHYHATWHCIHGMTLHS